MIAALFVEKDGAYFGIEGVDPWDISRDARTYPGPHPVVAHPPCERWGRYAKAGEWVCQVDQAHYGHLARKTTWLLYVGPKPPDLIWGPAEQRLVEKTHATRGYEKARKRGIIENMSSKARQRTPCEFRDLLLSLARNIEPAQASA